MDHVLKHTFLMVSSVAVLFGWISTLSLVFGGCCSNAITLQQITSEYPSSGLLITFLQFTFISIDGLMRHVTFSSPLPASRLERIPYPRLKPRKIALSLYISQVLLYFVVSLLNNVAFGYGIPMSVHVIFRSGGLIISMLLGRFVTGKRYDLRQTVSVFLVTIGIFIATLSVAESTGKSSSIANLHVSEYFAGIILLTLALLLSGLLGLLQEYTHSTYRSSKFPVHNAVELRRPVHPPWRESLFYLHFLAMPLFLTVRSDILAQLYAINNGPHFPIPVDIPPVVLDRLPPVPLTPANSGLPFGLIAQTHSLTLTVTFPRLYIPLILNTLTQLICVAGVNRLTTSVSNLTVTLVLTVRKAVSLMLSALLFRESAAAESVWLWIGAGFVLVGTVGYSLEQLDRNVSRLTKGNKRA